MEPLILQKNRDWLVGAVPQLSTQLTSSILDSIIFRQRENDIDLFYGGENTLEACNQTLALQFEHQLKRTDGVAVPRPSRKLKSASSIQTGIILSEIVDQHYEVLLDHLPAIPHDHLGEKLISKRPPYRNLVVFGSLMLVPLLSFLRNQKSSPWVSITLVEDDMSQFAATLSLVFLSDLVDVCKHLSVRLTLHVDSLKDNLQDRLYTQVGCVDPTVLYGWQTLRSPLLSPALMEIHSWLHAPEGAAQHVLGLLGFSTDEINQTQQAVWNSLAQADFHIVSPGFIENNLPVVLVASGPSLNDQLDWLRQYQSSLNIVSAGSALGSLLRYGIQPTAAVFLERGSQVYDDLSDLLAENFSLKNITVLASSTIDPRVPVFFKRAVFFHRPVAAATKLFPDDDIATLPVAGPHVINAALEALLVLGTRKFLLLGADFAAKRRDCPRADGALGSSPRDLNIPVSGSRGRTVFSEPGLLHTAYLLNRVIASTPDCEVFRLGEGVELDSTITTDASDQLAHRFGCMPCGLDSVFDELPLSTFSREDCSHFLDSMQTELSVWSGELIEAAQEAQGWSRPLVEAISPLVQRMHEGDSRHRRFLACLFCQPLFYSAAALHDCDSAQSKEWNKSRSDFIASVDLMQDLGRQWFDMMKTWIVSPQLPAWDPDGLRRRYCRLSETRV